MKMWDISYPFIAERRDAFPSPQGPRDCSRTEGTKFLPLGNLSVRGGCISLCTLTRGSVRPVSQHVFNVSGNSHNKQTRTHVGAYLIPQTSLSTGDTCFEKPEAQIIVRYECEVFGKLWTIHYFWCNRQTCSVHAVQIVVSRWYSAECRPSVGKSDTFDKLGLICAARLMSLFSHKPSIARHHLREKA